LNQRACPAGKQIIYFLIFKSYFYKRMPFAMDIERMQSESAFLNDKERPSEISGKPANLYLISLFFQGQIIFFFALSLRPKI